MRCRQGSLVDGAAFDTPPIRLVVAGVGDGTPSLAQRVVTEIAHVAVKLAVVNPAAVETVVNQSQSVGHRVVKI
jgi:hypothetical protein